MQVIRNAVADSITRELQSYVASNPGFTLRVCSDAHWKIEAGVLSANLYYGRKGMKLHIAGYTVFPVSGVNSAIAAITDIGARKALELRHTAVSARPAAAAAGELVDLARHRSILLSAVVELRHAICTIAAERDIVYPAGTVVIIRSDIEVPTGSVPSTWQGVVQPQGHTPPQLLPVLVESYNVWEYGLHRIVGRAGTAVGDTPLAPWVVRMINQQRT